MQVEACCTVWGSPGQCQAGFHPLSPNPLPEHICWHLDGQPDGLTKLPAGTKAHTCRHQLPQELTRVALACVAHSLPAGLSLGQANGVNQKHGDVKTALQTALPIAHIHSFP
jgi:hypothetical protein